jgi:two-component system, cell cycle sensor histidine kinase and response regulator CckA
MNGSFSVLVAIMLVAAMISLGVAAFCWPRRNAPGGRFFILLMMATAEWALASFGEFVSVSPDVKITWSKISYLGIASLPLLWLFFAAAYTQNLQWLARVGMTLLWAFFDRRGRPGF